MSKIEIDVSEQSLEDQIEAALGEVADGKYVLADSVKRVLRDFAAGKFAKAPLPEIVKPKWATHVYIERANDYVGKPFRVHAGGGEGCYMKGPLNKIESEAITAWNELFGGAS